MGQLEPSVGYRILSINALLQQAASASTYMNPLLFSQTVASGSGMASPPKLLMLISFAFSGVPNLKRGALCFREVIRCMRGASHSKAISKPGELEAGGGTELGPVHSKSEIRGPKAERNPKAEGRIHCHPGAGAAQIGRAHV